MEETPAIFDPLNIHGDIFRLWVIRQHLEIVGTIQINRIAIANGLAEVNSSVASVDDCPGSTCPGLRNEGCGTLLLRQMTLSESSTVSIAGRLLGLSLEGLPLDEPMRAAQKYVEITARDVQAAFAKWIRPSDFVQVSLGPKPD